MKDFGNYKTMRNFIGKKENLFDACLPIYDSSSIIATIKTFLFGHSKKVYDGSVMDLLGQNANDIFKSYQLWGNAYNDSLYINVIGLNAISFGVNDNGIITYVSYGRSHEGEKIIERAKEVAKAKNISLEVKRSGNMRGIYYVVKICKEEFKTPSVKITSSSTLSGDFTVKVLTA